MALADTRYAKRRRGQLTWRNRIRAHAQLVDTATEEADDGALDRCVLCDLTGKRVDVKEATCTGRPATTFEQAFAVERDAGFDDFLHGPVGPRSTP